MSVTVRTNFTSNLTPFQRWVWEDGNEEVAQFKEGQRGVVVRVAHDDEEEDDDENAVFGAALINFHLVGERWVFKDQYKHLSFGAMGARAAVTVGDRVRRGPDWEWGDQDAHGAGTVIGAHSARYPRWGWVQVKWDNGYMNEY
eukprot:gene35264-63314_t